MSERLLWVFALTVLLTGLSVTGDTAAQNDPEPAVTDVYVTVQDFAALRAGPGRHWDRLAVLPAGTTYRATGRTINARWIQVAYEGPLDAGARREFTRGGITYGWVAYWLLIWSGNILELPIDGVQLVPTARAAGPLMFPPYDYMYEDEIDPSKRVTDVERRYGLVEVTGRLGSTRSGFFGLQFKLDNRYYWTGTWATGVPAGYIQLPDASYLYPYGRLLESLRSELDRARRVLSDIGGRWRALGAGRTTTCNAIPDDYLFRGLNFRVEDLNLEPIFRPVAEAMYAGRDAINSALERFRAVCAGPTRQISPDEIRLALADIETAERYLTITALLLTPFAQRDPVLGDGGP
jgi:hypothetical protein